MEYALVVLAVYRLSLLATREVGPFGVAQAWRNRFLAEDWIGHGVRCLWCVSFWLALPAAWLLPGDWWLNWLGLAGAVVVLDKVIER